MNSPTLQLVDRGSQLFVSACDIVPGNVYRIIGDAKYGGLLVVGVNFDDCNIGFQQLGSVYTWTWRKSEPATAPSFQLQPVDLDTPER